MSNATVTPDSSKFFDLAGGALPDPGVARGGLTGAFCSECDGGHYLGFGGANEHPRCPNTGSFASRILVQERDRELVEPATAVAAVTKRDWWHFTTRAEWPPVDRIVHLGSLEASLSRVSNQLLKLEAEKNEDDALASLLFYKVRVTDAFDLSEVIYCESFDNGWESGHDSLVNDQVIRYINAMEDPGSVSIALHSRHLKVVDHIRTPLTTGLLYELQRIRSLRVE